MQNLSGNTKIDKLPSTWNDVQEYEQFFREIKDHNSNLSDRQIDKYLMIYGKNIKKPSKTRRMKKFNPHESSVSQHNKELPTWTGRSTFSYSGSIKEGTRISYGNKPYNYTITTRIYQKLLKHFSGSTVPCGTSRTNPDRNSLGRWLQEYVTKTALASYVSSILIYEGYAKKEGNMLSFYRS